MNSEPKPAGPCGHRELPCSTNDAEPPPSADRQDGAFRPVRGRWDPPAHPVTDAHPPADSDVPNLPSPDRRTGACALLVLAVALGLPAFARAGTAGSASYAVRTDALDAGGRSSTSALYRQEGSLGGFGGVATAAASAGLIKHGYAGQLYEIATVVVVAGSTNVDEGATRQLSAVATLDDGSALRLPGAQVAWSVVLGPIAHINADGLATAGQVYRATGVTVQGAYGSRRGTLGLWVRNVDDDNFGTYAGDGVDDAWQVQYFGEVNPSGLAAADPDGDGQNNAYEETVGSIPTDADSRFRFRLERVPGFGGRMNLIFSPRVAGRTYVVQERPEAGAGAFSDLGAMSVVDAGPVRTVTDLSATGTNKVYRVRVTKP